MGTVSSARLVIDQVPELYDYDAVRSRSDACVYVGSPASTMVVLGSTQSPELLRTDVANHLVYRRRGGGGVVLLRPGDLWLDWWLPADSPGWFPDVRSSALLVGEWWASALADAGGEVTVHDGPLDGDPMLRVACFAGRGVGEVFVDGRKAVGLTQWRVREGSLISTVLPAASTEALATLFATPPMNLSRALEHASLASLGLTGSIVVDRVLARVPGVTVLTRP